MRNVKRFLTLTFGGFVAFVALGQELDDMYFNSKDRAKINERKITADLGLAQKSNQVSESTTRINPTDSYSARNINPEYASQLTGDAGQTLVEDDYFLPDFQPTGINQNISNCNCNTGSYYNPYYSNAFNNPYYGFNNGFGSPYNNYYPSSWGYPYNNGFGSGLTMSLGYGWGSFGPSFYNGYGYGSYANNFWNPYNPWGGNYYGSYYYPRQVIVINNGDAPRSRVSYAKRSSRSSNLNHYVDSPRPGNSGNVVGSGRTAISGGRSRSASPEYYDSGWKRNQNTNPTRGYWSNTAPGTNSNTRTDFNRGTNTGGRQSYDFSSPSRSSFNSGGVNSGGSRSSGSSGSSGGSRTRGRNN